MNKKKSKMENVELLARGIKIEKKKIIIVDRRQIRSSAIIRFLEFRTIKEFLCS